MAAGPGALILPIPLHYNIELLHLLRADRTGEGALAHQVAAGEGRGVRGRSGVFERVWTKAKVRMDCNTWEATIEMTGGAEP